MSAEQQPLPSLRSSFHPEALGANGSPKGPRADMEDLRRLVNERLAEAVDGILEVFVETVFRYHEQIDSQRRQLDSLMAAEEKRNRAADIQWLMLNHEEVPPEQQVQTPRLDQEDPLDPSCIKEEEEKLCSSKEGEQLEGLGESDVSRFTFAPGCVKSEEEEEEEEEPEFSGFYQNEGEKTDSEAEGEKTDSEACEQSEPGNHIKTEPEAEAHVGGGCEDAGGHQMDGNPSQQSRSQAAGGKTFSYSFFGNRFAQKGSVKPHLTLHTAQKRFSCSVCEKTFSHKRTLSRHFVSHSGERPFCCSVCGKRFARKENLKQHFVLHTGEKPFRCSVCGKSFAQHGTLSRHVSVHSANKPFSCSLCGREFARKENLKRHSSVHDKESSSATFKFFI